MTPIKIKRLGGLNPSRPQNMPFVPSQAEVRHGPFLNPAYQDMLILSRKDDHVTAMVDGQKGEYAIGHLAPYILAMLTPESVHKFVEADANKRTVLGIEYEYAIDHLLDRNPGICPIALSLIRMHAPDPVKTINHYIASAPLGGEMRGEETCQNNKILLYDVSDGILTVEWREDEWRIEGRKIFVKINLPEALCAASIGKRLEDVVDHPAFAKADAFVKDAKQENGEVQFIFDAPAVQARKTPEAFKRRGN